MPLHWRIAAIGLLTLAACTRRNDDGFVTAASFVASPVAAAPEDFDVAGGATGVTLDGSKSRDPQGATLDYLWEQIGGTTPVALVAASSAIASFDAPAAPEVLTFRLTVRGASGADADTVTVTVKPIVVAAPDLWLAGYGRSGSIVPTVAGGSGALTFTWTGFEPWFSADWDSATGVLDYSTPPLTELQNFPFRAEVLVPAKAEGRLQLKVLVKDGTGATDEDFVNFSVGPLGSTSMGEAAAPGEPVFLNGGADYWGALWTWTWSGWKPDGNPVAFYKPDQSPLGTDTSQRFVYFIPDQTGVYEIIRVQGPDGKIHLYRIVCADHVGVGTGLGRTPDAPKGECGSCHSGAFEWMEDLHSPWRGTAHASAYSRLLDASDPYYGALQAKGSWRDAFDFGSEFSIDRRTVGWSPIATGRTGGWAERAAAEGYALQGTSWDALKRRQPGTANVSGVQCESCHGPGSLHAGDSTRIRKSYDASLCGRCHARILEHWETGVIHTDVASLVSAREDCNGCHTGQGFVAEMRRRLGTSPIPVLYQVAASDRPVVPLEDRRGTTCQACHDPHRRTPGRSAGGADPQLRAYGFVRFRNDGVVWAGSAAVCFTCHNSGTDSRSGSADTDERRGPHYSPAAEMLAGIGGMPFDGWTNGYGGSVHADASGNRQCLSCHFDAEPAEGAPGHGAVAGHTFHTDQDGGGLIGSPSFPPLNPYTGGGTVAGSKKFRVTGGPSWIGRTFPGDSLNIATGPDADTCTVVSVDSAHQITVERATDFAGTSGFSWTLTSVPKYHTAACAACHSVPSDFRVIARGDYDGNTAPEAVQDEISGLLDALKSAINARLQVLVGPAFYFVGGPYLSYTDGATTRRFPGPASDNPDILWPDLDETLQAEWTALYKAAYNYRFVYRDGSGGIHNTGYAVNLLQSSYWAITGSTIGQPFLPCP